MGEIRLASWERVQWVGLIYGNPGIGKSCFAAMLPKPMKVFMFDPFSKALAYLQQGDVQPRQEMEDGGEFQFVVDPTSKELVVELEYFRDKNPAGIGSEKTPCAYERFHTSLVMHMNEGWLSPEGTPYASVILDSYTFCELAAKRYCEYKINPAPGGMQDSKHNQMQWAGQARGLMERDIISNFPWLPCHGAVLAHVDDQLYDQQELRLWGINAIGKLGSSIPGAFSEVYFMYREGDTRRFVTSDNSKYIVQTHIGAPNGCEAIWEAIWANQ